MPLWSRHFFSHVVVGPFTPKLCFLQRKMQLIRSIFYLSLYCDHYQRRHSFSPPTLVPTIFIIIIITLLLLEVLSKVHCNTLQNICNYMFHPKILVMMMTIIWGLFSLQYIKLPFQIIVPFFFCSSSPNGWFMGSPVKRASIYICHLLPNEP